MIKAERYPQAEPPHRWLYSYRCEVVRVVDGDTIEFDLDLGLGIWARRTIRLYGVNAWEMRHDKGPAAKQFAREWLEQRTVFIHTIRDKKGKYGRYLASVFDTETVECLNDALVEHGHAVQVLG